MDESEEARCQFIKPGSNSPILLQLIEETFHQHDGQCKNECITYLEALEEALCYGWIDSTVRKYIRRKPDGRLPMKKKAIIIYK